jgi:hypothetical protein
VWYIIRATKHVMGMHSLPDGSRLLRVVPKHGTASNTQALLCSLPTPHAITSELPLRSLLYIFKCLT